MASFDLAKPSFMNHFSTFSLCLLAIGLSSPCMAADKPFVTVNGTAVSQATAAMYMDKGQANGMTDPAALKSQVREQIIQRELLFQAAHKAGYDKRPEVAAEAEAARRKVLVEADAVRQTIIIRRYAQYYVEQHPVSDEDLKAMYDQMKSAGTGLEYKAHHVLVRNQAEADAIARKLKGGARFEELARNSTDPTARLNGGDLGWITTGRFDKPVSDALIRLKKGDYTDTPIKTDEGYHVIALDDTRALKVPALEDMKPMLRKQAQDQILLKLTGDLRTSASIR